MKKIVDFTSVSASGSSFDFVRYEFVDLQSIIDDLPILLDQKKLLPRIIYHKLYNNRFSHILKNYEARIRDIHDEGILEVLYAHYAFIISGTFKELQELPDIDLNKPINIPTNLSDPIAVISSKLSVPPILTYYSHLILNWDHEKDRPIRRFSIKPKESEKNESVNDFESGFMEVHIKIEKRSVQIINILGKIIEAFKIGEIFKYEIIAENLNLLSHELDRILDLLKTMYNKCLPSEYAKYIRIFLGSYKKMQISGKDTIDLPGPSAAQSPTLLLFNYIFKANKSPNESLSLVLKSAADSIPNDRMEIIVFVAGQFHAHFPLIKSNQKSFQAYIELYANYLQFLVEHFKLVFDYIIGPCQQMRNKSASSQEEGTGTSNPQDLSARVKLIYQDILNLCDEYNKIYHDQYSPKKLNNLYKVICQSPY